MHVRPRFAPFCVTMVQCVNDKAGRACAVATDRWNPGKGVLCGSVIGVKEGVSLGLVQQRKAFGASLHRCVRRAASRSCRQLHARLRMSVIRGYKSCNGRRRSGSLHPRVCNCFRGEHFRLVSVSCDKGVCRIEKRPVQRTARAAVTNWVVPNLPLCSVTIHEVNRSTPGLETRANESLW